MTLRTLTIAHIAAMLVVTAIAILLACSARAEYAPTYRAEFRWPWEPTACEECRRIREYRRRQREREWHARQHYERRHAKVWREDWRDRDDDRDERGRHCQSKLAVVGDQYASESGAQEESNKAWMQAARWQYGERYMSRDHAIEATYECGRSSVGSVVGQVFYRCRLSARPCSAPKTRAN